jgi:hypothetical protein
MIKMMMRISTIVPMPMNIPDLLPVGALCYPASTGGNVRLTGARLLRRSGAGGRKPGSIPW